MLPEVTPKPTRNLVSTRARAMSSVSASWTRPETLSGVRKQMCSRRVSDVSGPRHEIWMHGLTTLAWFSFCFRRANDLGTFAQGHRGARCTETRKHFRWKVSERSRILQSCRIKLTMICFSHVETKSTSTQPTSTASRLSCRPHRKASWSEYLHVYVH